MRLAIISLLAFSPLAASAAAFECTDLLVSFAEDNKTVRATVPWKASYASAPTWDLEKGGEPPLSVSKAAKAALSWARSKYKDEKISVHSITLMPLGCGAANSWDYWVSIGSEAHSETVVVLMDGTVAVETPKATRK